MNALMTDIMSRPMPPGLFRKTLSSYVTGVAVVTTSTGSGPAGMTINSFASVSLEPPLVLWSIRNSSALGPVFLRAERWGINVLHAGQQAVANRFCAQIDDRFEGMAWRSSAGRTPMIDGAVAYLECLTRQVVSAGDHTILIGEVQDLIHRGGSALAFFEGKYQEIEFRN